MSVGRIQLGDGEVLHRQADDGDNSLCSSGLAYRPLEKVTFRPEEAIDFLGLPSRKALQRLVDRRALVPLTYTRPHVFHRLELDRFLSEQLGQERQRRGIDADALAGE